jgi:hypothetical protein
VFIVDIAIQMCIIETSGAGALRGGGSDRGRAMEQVAMLGFAGVMGAVVYLLGGMLLRKVG